MKNVLIKVALLLVLTTVFCSCSEKRGIDKIKEGAKEVSEDISDDAEAVKEDNKDKKIKVKFGK